MTDQPDTAAASPATARQTVRPVRPLRIAIEPRAVDPASDAAALAARVAQVARGGARAAVLGVNASTLRRRIKKLGISRAAR